MMRLYDSRFSGNSWKVRILLNQIQRPFERITLDLDAGDTKKQSFVELNRFARIPVLQLPDGRTIVESAAILLYLAEGTDYLFDDPYLRSQIAGWLFFEQGDLQKSIAWPRVYHLKGRAEDMSREIDRLQADGYAGLEKLEQWLLKSDWLVGGRYTIADIAVFAYVSLAHEGGYRMDRFPSIARWLESVRSQPGWLGLLERSPYQNG